MCFYFSKFEDFSSQGPFTNDVMSMNSHFWFDKMSNRNTNTIRGQVVYPKLVKECKEEKDKEILNLN